MVSGAVRMLRDREPSRNIGLEIHRRGRARDHRALDVVAVQVHHDAPVARPAQLHVLAFAHAKCFGRAGGETPAGERDIERFRLRESQRCPRKERERQREAR